MLFRFIIAGTLLAVTTWAFVPTFRYMRSSGVLLTGLGVIAGFAAASVFV